MTFISSADGHEQERTHVLQDIQVPEAKDLNPDKAASSKRAGDEAFVARDYSKAVTIYSESLQHDTRNHLVWANRSAASLKTGDATGALRDARVSRKLDSKYLKAGFPNS